VKFRLYGTRHPDRLRRARWIGFWEGLRSPFRGHDYRSARRRIFDDAD
jgi:hypothetical protein